MKKKIIVLGSIALLVSAFLVTSLSKGSKDLSGAKAENLQELLQNFNPGDEAVAYADSIL